MRSIRFLAAVLALLAPSTLRAESYRVDRAPDGSVRVLSRVLADRAWTVAAPQASEATSPDAAALAGAVRIARSFALSKSELLGLQGVALSDAPGRASPGAVHARFPTTVSDPTSLADGLPIFAGEVAVHLNTHGEVLLLTNDARGPLLAPAGSSSGLVGDQETALARALSAIGTHGSFYGEPRVTLVAARTAAGFRRAWQIECAFIGPAADWLVLVDAADGLILFKNDRIIRFDESAEADSSGSGMVFDPQPITASGNTSLSDTSQVDQYRVLRPLQGLDGSGYLRGSYVDANHTLQTPPGRGQQSNHFYDYSRNDAPFEEVNVYYHIDRLQRLLQSYGFRDANNRQIAVDVHAIPDDNSFYYFGTRSLAFGDGGVDDAEDEEIVLHEYGHAVHHNIVSGLGTAPDASDVRALSEGWSDYIAASYGGDPCVGEWDATSYSTTDPPCLRRTDEFLVYPTDIDHEPHTDGKIWSSTLWATREALGRTIADRLAIQSYYFTSGTSSFRDAGWALILSDWTLYSGAHRGVLETILGVRGLLPAPEELLLADDDAVMIGLGFPFQLASATYDSAYVGSNGDLTFGEPDASPDASLGALPEGPPRVALFWRDLDPSPSTVHLERWSGGVTIHYDSVAVAGASVPLSASITLFRDTNGIQFTYENAPAASVLVGVTAGGGLVPAPVAFEAPPIASAPAGGLYEMFTAQPGASFALAGRSLRFTLQADGSYAVLDPNLPTAVAVTHFEALAEPGAVRLRWGLPAGSGVIGFRVARGADGEASGSFIGALEDVANGENEYVDQTALPGTTYRYWVHLVERGGSTTVIGPVSATPRALVAKLLAPNPFHAGAAFRAEGVGTGEATISIFDVRGRRVRELRGGPAPSGRLEIAWGGEDESGRSLSAGIYFVRLRGENATLRQRILLLR